MAQREPYLAGERRHVRVRAAGRVPHVLGREVRLAQVRRDRLGLVGRDGKIVGEASAARHPRLLVADDGLGDEICAADRRDVRRRGGKVRLEPPKKESTRAAEGKQEPRQAGA